MRRTSDGGQAVREPVGVGAGGQVLAGPRVDAAQLWLVVLRLRQVAALAGAGMDRLPAAEPEWSGTAAAAFGRAREAAGRRLELTGTAAGRVGQVLGTYAQAVETCQGEVRACAQALDRIDAERQRRAVLMAAGLPDPGWADLAGQVRSVLGRYQRALDVYASAVSAATGQLAAVYEQVPAGARGMSVGDRVEQGFRGFAQTAFVQPVQGVWALTGEGLSDPTTWAAAVTAVPGALWDQVRHPLRTAEQAVGADAWGHDNGDWTRSAGGTLGAVAGMVLGPLGEGGEIAREAELVTTHAAEHSVEHTAEHSVEDAPLQDFADTLDHVDLDSHERHGGHTLREHDQRDEKSLGERACRMADERSAGAGKPKAATASAFGDQATAEEWITHALNANTANIDDWLHNIDKEPGIFDMYGPMPHDAGIVVRCKEGVATRLDPGGVRVLLRRNEHGVVVYTAFLLPAP